jgi:hypothetical protein
MWLCRGNNIAMEGSDKDHNLIVRCIISVRVLGVGLLNVKIGHLSMLIACTTPFTIIVVFVLL